MVIVASIRVMLSSIEAQMDAGEGGVAAVSVLAFRPRLRPSRAEILAPPAPPHSGNAFRRTEAHDRLRAATGSRRRRSTRASVQPAAYFSYAAGPRRDSRFEPIPGRRPGQPSSRFRRRPPETQAQSAVRRLTEDGLSDSRADRPEGLTARSGRVGDRHRKGCRGTGRQPGARRALATSACRTPRAPARAASGDHGAGRPVPTAQHADLDDLPHLRPGLAGAP